MSHPTENQLAIAPGSYVLDPESSTISFTTRHLFGLGKVHGTFSLAEGRVTVAEEPDHSSATAVIDAGSFTTDSGARDKTVRSAKYLDTATHPHITFTSQTFSTTDSGYTLSGELSVKGVRQPVELAVDAPRKEAEATRFHATTTIDRYAFGITVDKGMTARYLTLTLDILAVPSTASAGE